MEVAMSKKVLIGAVAVFVALSIFEFVIHGVLLTSSYEATKDLWRSLDEMNARMWMFYVIYAFIGLTLSYIFSKGYEGKGLVEGIRFGFFVGLLMNIPRAYGSFVVMDIPYSLALSWFLYGMVEYLILGAILAMVFGKQALVTRAVAA
jgi:hypothetical protein